MRKFVVIMLVWLGMGTVVCAQNFGFGPKVGLNIAMVSGDVTESPSPRLGINVGAFAEYKFTKMWAVEGSLMYSAQGVKDEWDNGDMMVNSTTQANYINIPVLAKCYLVRGFNVFVGPQVGFLLKAETTHEADGQPSQNIDLKDNCNKMAISGIAGFGYQFDMGLNLSANFMYGLNDVLKQAEGEKLKNRHCVIQVTAGWRF